MSRDLGLDRSPGGAGLRGRATLDAAQARAVAGLNAAWRSHPGRVRRGNEDAIAVAALPRDGGLLLVLSDGMGGHAGGGVASQLVCARLIRAADDLASDRPARARYEVLRAAIQDADRLVRVAAAEQEELSDMGATVVVAAVSPSHALHLYAGDSRLYLFRRGRTWYRTQDHTVVGVLQQHGHLAEADVSRHPQRNRLLSCVGGGSDRSRCDPAPGWRPDACASEAELALMPHDTLLLCSDGLTSQVPDATIQKLVSQPGVSASTLATSLVDAALAAGGNDNITVGVVRVTEA